MTTFRSIRLLLTLVLLHIAITGKAAANERLVFVNQPYNIHLFYFESFFQDHLGRVWAGSNVNGPMLYNGQTFKSFIPQLTQNSMHCAYMLSKSEYLIGCKGLYVYDFQNVKARVVRGTESEDIMRIFSSGRQKILCVGRNKLFLYNSANKRASLIKSWDRDRLSDACHLKGSLYLLLGYNTGPFLYDVANNSLRPITVKGLPYGSSVFLNVKAQGDKLWIGTNKGLYSCSLAGNVATEVEEVLDKTIKCLLFAKDGSLLVGTNFGLYVKTGASWQHYTHSVTRPESILSNTIWSIFQDKAGNFWIGVDGGLSFVKANNPVNRVKWSWNAVTTDGNRITAYLFDSKGRIWTGGTNGLSCHDTVGGQTIIFNRFNAKSLPNNTIRDIYEDRHGTVWICTDRSIAYYDDSEHAFVPLNIVDRKSGRTSLWAYGIVEDRYGYMWIATCSGGLFVVKRDKLINGKGKEAEADCNYYTRLRRYSIPYSGILGITITANGDVWADADNYIYGFDRSSVTLPGRPTVVKSNHVRAISSTGNEVWACGKDYLMRISSVDKEPKLFDMKGYTDSYGMITDVAASENSLWILTERSLAVTGTRVVSAVHRLDLGNEGNSCIAVQRSARNVWIGGIDYGLVYRSNVAERSVMPVNVNTILTEVYVNGKQLLPGDGNSNSFVHDLAFTNSIDLDTEENDIAFRLSTGIPYSQSGVVTGLFHRLKGVDKDWKAILPDNRLISYPILKWGSYQLQIGSLDKDGGTIKVRRTIDIDIAAPWYQTWWFKVLLILAFAYTIFQLFNHYRLRANLRIAEEDRRQTLELTKQKINFFATMSNELKTPLTKITGTVSSLLNSSIGPSTRLTLQGIQQNVSYISHAISQMISIKDNPMFVTPSQDTLNEMAALVRNSANQDERFLETVDSIILYKLDDPELGVKTLAAQMGISEKQLYRRIKEITGSTVVDYLKSYRLNKAKEILSQGQFSVKEVAYMTGFTSPSYFSRCFTEKFGVSPSKLLDNQQK